MNEKLHKVVGIDLGTTYSAVAAYNTYQGGAEIVRNPESDPNPEVTASVVSLDPVSRKAIVGSAAKRNIAVCPDDTIVEIKREMGEMFNDKTLEIFRAKGIFSTNDPVRVLFAEQRMLPQEISALILMKMKEVAEREIGEEIRDAVVTVPAYFKEPQKKATEEAALMAGLYPRQIIPEPTAAAIYYGLNKPENEKKTYLVYDLGGGTFDVSIIQVETGSLNVIATSGDPRLGGGDFDEAITVWALEELRKKGVAVGEDRLTRAKIKARAESAKIVLSYNETTNLVLEFVQPGASLELTRSCFLSLIDVYLRKSLTYVDAALNLAKSQKGVDRDQIDAILLVGGSTKIPRIRTLLLDYFSKDESFIRFDLNPDSVVALGAASVAQGFLPTPGPFDIRRPQDTLKENRESDITVVQRLITEHSLGIGVQDNICVRLIDAGSNIPFEITRGGFANPGPVSHLRVPVFQGEGKFQFENTLIGELTIGPMEPKPEGFHQFEVTFKLDKNGLLTMFVKHLNENKVYEAKFDQKTGVGGYEALAALRTKLLALYAHGGPQPTAAASTGGAGGITPPPPPQPGAPVAAHAAPPAQLAAPAAGTLPADIVEPTVPVPEQFKQMVRRAHKLLLKQAEPDLLRAFNAFITALNSGKPESELEEPGDELAEIFDKANK